MALPISLSPAPIGGDKRIVKATPNQFDGARQSSQGITLPQPRVPLSKLTEAARRLVGEGPPFDNVRIAQIRQAIASGQYRTDAAAIADAILSRVPPSKS